MEVGYHDGDSEADEDTSLNETSLNEASSVQPEDEPEEDEKVPRQDVDHRPASSVDHSGDMAYGEISRAPRPSQEMIAFVFDDTAISIPVFGGT